MKKKTIKVIFTLFALTVFIAVTAASVSAAVTKDGILPFEDVKNTAWYAEAAEFCYVNGVVRGMNEYTFAPSGELTRAQFVLMLANADGVDVSVYETNQFNDVKPGQWYYNAVSWAYDTGIVSGTSEHGFSPNDSITREAVARIMSLYMQKKGIKVEISDGCLDRFIDREAVSDWALDSMKYTVTAGLISGVTDNTLEPVGNVTRAQAARIFMLYLKSYASEAHEHSYAEASCTESSYCTVCGIKDGLPLGHNVSDDFSCKSEYRSKCTKCGYEVSSDFMPHSYAEATCGSPETCVDCSAQRGTTVGDHQWWAATCTVSKMCKVCYKTEGNALGHSWKAADCTVPKTCTRCKLTEGSALSTSGQHNWWSATCKNPKMCKVCYKTEGSALGHSWKAADCVDPKTCTRWGCGATDGTALSTSGQHTWWSATCKNPKMCKVCYKTEGSALGHSWKAADCVDPKTCTRWGCGATDGTALSTSGQHTWWSATCKNPKMCKVCYKTEGSALGHSWKAADCVDPMTCTRCKITQGSAISESRQHTWWSATCKNPKMCKVCYKTEGSALGHSWKAADCITSKTCTRCKITEGTPLSTSGQHSWQNADCTKPKNCTTCKKTEGSPLGHEWNEGSCTEARTCTRCKVKEGTAQGHSFRTIDGVRNCSRCGTPEKANGKTVYLTFDDGPGKYTQALLNTLDRYSVKATFFVVDTGYMYLLPEMAKAGHTVAMHSSTHNYNRIYSSETAYFNDLYAIQNRIKEYTGKLSKILRFPGGSSNGVSRFNPGIMTRLTNKLKSMGYRYFDWNVDSNDAGGTRTASGVYSNVINGIKRNQDSIVLQHDIKGYSVEAVDDIIIWGLKNGYTFKALDMNSPVCEHYVNN